MHLIEIPEKRFKTYIPEDLSECNMKQYIDLSTLIMHYMAGSISYSDWRTSALYLLLNLKEAKEELPTKIEENKNSNIYQLSKILDSFFEEESETGNKVIKQYYINNPIYKIKVSASKTLFGPSNEFNNVKFGEYVDALSHFADYNETKESVYLYQLFSTFYREKMENPETADVRIQYNPDKVYKKATKARRYPPGIIFGFYLLFASFQKYISSAKLYIEGKEIDLSILFNTVGAEKKSTKSNIQGIGMKSILFSVAESGVFGPLKEVRETSLWEILIRMYDIRKRDLDAQSNNKTE